MTWQQVVADNPYLTFFLVLFAGSGLFTCVFRCWNRFMRHLNIIINSIKLIRTINFHYCILNNIIIW